MCFYWNNHMKILWICKIFSEPNIYYMHFNTLLQWKRLNSSYTEPPMILAFLWVSSAYPTCNIVFAIKNFPKRIILAHSKFSLELAKEYSKLFSTFLSSASKVLCIKRAVRMGSGWTWSRKLPERQQRRDFIVKKMQTALLIM